jgi:hypothetical protein
MHTEFHKDWFRHSKVDIRDSQTHRQHGDLMSQLLFFQNKENKLQSMREYLFECISNWSTLNKRIKIGKNFSTIISATLTEVIVIFLSPSRQTVDIAAKIMSRVHDQFIIR